VGWVGLVFILLLGTSGCAGFPQRSIGSAPSSAAADDQPVTPPGLFSWWHRSSRIAAQETSSAEQLESERPGERYPVANQSATNPWPETQSEWMARNFPRFNRLWNGTPAGYPRESPSSGEELSTSRVPLSRPDAANPTTASAPRSDGAVQPTYSSSGYVAGSNGDGKGQLVQNPDDLPESGRSAVCTVSAAGAVSSWKFARACDRKVVGKRRTSRADPG
jgi:hypothetical protein